MSDIPRTDYSDFIKKQQYSLRCNEFVSQM